MGAPGPDAASWTNGGGAPADVAVTFTHNLNATWPDVEVRPEGWPTEFPLGGWGITGATATTIEVTMYDVPPGVTVETLLRVTRIANVVK